MNFSELKSELFARGANYLEEDAENVARAERWLNQAYREIVNLHAWPFLEAVATGTEGAGEVSIPDLRKIRFVTDISDGGDPGRRLHRTSLDDLVAEDDADLTLTGTPEHYYVDAGNIVKGYPVGGTIRVHYIKRAPALTGSEEPLFSEEYHDLIVDRAMIKVYKDSDNFEAAIALRGELDLGLASMAEDYLLNSRDIQYIPSDHFYDG